MNKNNIQPENLRLSSKARLMENITAMTGRFFLFSVCSLSAIAVLFIFFFIARDAIPFFQANGFREFFTGLDWYPSASPGSFGARAIFIGTGLVTLASTLVSVILGVSAAVCLSDILPFSWRQAVKPVVETLAAIPSVAYGFFALVIFAPLLQQNGGKLLSTAWWIVFTPVFLLLTIIFADIISNAITGKKPHKKQQMVKTCLTIVLAAIFLAILFFTGRHLAGLQIVSGTNALNVSIILGIMALPTVVSVSEDALQSVGTDIREASYALGATRAETILKTVIPAASSGICAAIILGVMRAVGETMVVWMASGNAAQVPQPWFNLLEPVRTLTATIAGDMGEADHVTGSSRYHVLFAMATSLLVMSFFFNHLSEFIIKRRNKRLKG